MYSSGFREKLSEIACCRNTTADTAIDRNSQRGDLEVKIARSIVLVAWFLFDSVYANSENILLEETMCYSHEEIYFSCPIGQQIVSVCASGNISPNNGYVQYRFGHPGKPEFEFPAKPYPPMGRFAITGFFGGSVNSTHLKFNSRGYDYVIYQSATSGVYVKKNGKTIVNLSCDDGVYQQISPRAMRGIKTVEPDDNDD
jgi:hypothetical protein